MDVKHKSVLFKSSLYRSLNAFTNVFIAVFCPCEGCHVILKAIPRILCHMQANVSVSMEALAKICIFLEWYVLVKAEISR